MKATKVIASLVFAAGILLCGTNFEVFAAENDTAREVDDEYKTYYEEDLTMNIDEEDESYRIYSIGRTIEWYAEKTDEVMYTSANVFARQSSPNKDFKDELCLPKGTEVQRVGISENGWDIIKYNDELYFVWYEYLTDEKPVIPVAEKEVTTDSTSTETVEVTIVDESGSTDGTYVGYYELTAYCATGNPCADGVYPSVGYTAACNDSRLWHHWVYIEGYGTYYIHDTGGMASNVIDIFMGSYDECIAFGRQGAYVYYAD
jgi:3D (Asp-Asp-Asp) domain-containing protein